MPAEATLETYNANYFASAHGGKPQTPIATAFFSGIARLRLAYVERYLREQNIVASRVLELGPGLGFFARHWLERDPGNRYMAVEADTSCHAALRELGARLVESSMAAGEVDLVVMSHVLEHVPDPVKFLEDATRNLRNGGGIFIEVPCRDWEHKPIDEPHLLFFDKKPMRRLLTTLRFKSIRLSYYGQKISRLRSAPALHAKWVGLRSRLIGLGVVAPFASFRLGMEALGDPLERAAVAPLKAHCESLEPSWWLRAMARKGF